MRPIKFRAWDGSKMTCYGIRYNRSSWSLEEVNEKPLMQYTGLRDKNGVEIFEGDIVKHPCGAYGVITWIMAEMRFGITQGWCHPVYGNPPPTESEIIGNIYENPEQLE